MRSAPRMSAPGGDLVGHDAHVRLQLVVVAAQLVERRDRRVARTVRVVHRRTIDGRGGRHARPRDAAPHAVTLGTARPGEGAAATIDAGPPGAGSGPVVLSPEVLVEGRRRSREPGLAVRGDAPQHRLAGAGPHRRAGRLDGQGTSARRLQRGHGSLPRSRPDARQAADLHERLGARRPEGARPRARPAGRPPRRRRRLRPAVRQAPLPRGRRRGRPQRPALDHRRARDREVQPAAGRDRRARPECHRPRPVDVRARRAAAARRAPRCGGRRGRGLGTRRDEQGGQPLQHVRAAPRRHDATRRGGRGRRPARRRRHPPDADRLARIRPPKADA